MQLFNILSRDTPPLNLPPSDTPVQSDLQSIASTSAHTRVEQQDSLLNPPTNNTIKDWVVIENTTTTALNQAESAEQAIQSTIEPGATNPTDEPVGDELPVGDAPSVDNSKHNEPTFNKLQSHVTAKDFKSFLYLTGSLSIIALSHIFSNKSNSGR